MKKNTALAALLAALLLWGQAPAPKAQALTKQTPETVNVLLQAIEGPWYDANGNLVLDIKAGTINGCQVESGWDFTGGRALASGRLEILESIGLRSLYFNWQLLGNNQDYLTLNGQQTLHRLPQLPYYESAAGLHLGMSVEQVARTLGQPDKSGHLLPIYPQDGWYYAPQKLVVQFQGDTVSQIVLLPGSPVKLQQSGLGSGDSPQAFAQFYHWDKVPQVDWAFNGCLSIGHGEYLSLGKNVSQVTLTIRAF